MPDIHIVKKSADNKTIDVIFHFPVPVGNNAADVSWPQAFLIEAGGQLASQLYGIDSAELAQIVAAQVIEHRTNIRFSSINLTNAERLAEVIEKYNDTQTSFFAVKQIELEFTGYVAGAI